MDKNENKNGEDQQSLVRTPKAESGAMQTGELCHGTVTDDQPKSEIVEQKKSEADV